MVCRAPLSRWTSSRGLSSPSPPHALPLRPLPFPLAMAAPPKRTISITHPHSNYCQSHLLCVCLCCVRELVADLMFVSLFALAPSSAGAEPTSASTISSPPAQQPRRPTNPPASQRVSYSEYHRPSRNSYVAGQPGANGQGGLAMGMVPDDDPAAYDPSSPSRNVSTSSGRPPQSPMNQPSSNPASRRQSGHGQYAGGGGGELGGRAPNSYGPGYGSASATQTSGLPPSSSMSGPPSSFVPSRAPPPPPPSSTGSSSQPHSPFQHRQVGPPPPQQQQGSNLYGYQQQQQQQQHQFGSGEELNSSPVSYNGGGAQGSPYGQQSSSARPSRPNSAQYGQGGDDQQQSAGMPSPMGAGQGSMMMAGGGGGGSQLGGPPSSFGLDKGRNRERSGTGKSSEKGGKKGFLSSFSGTYSISLVVLEGVRRRQTRRRGGGVPHVPRRRSDELTTFALLLGHLPPPRPPTAEMLGNHKSIVISTPYDPVHLTHVGFNNDTGECESPSLSTRRTRSSGWKVAV